MCIDNSYTNRKERDVEKKLIKSIEQAGGLCLKFVSPGNAGVPDRIVLLPGGKIRFVEVKAPGKKPTRLQEWWIARLQALGFEAEWVDHA
jgi:hypothetical protein